MNLRGWFFVQKMLNPTWFNRAERFVPRVACVMAHTYLPALVSLCHISFSSGIWNIVEMQWFSSHSKCICTNEEQVMVRAIACWMMCMNDGWKDSDDVLEAIVIIIYKFDIGWFCFLKVLSVTEILHERHDERHQLATQRRIKQTWWVDCGDQWFQT
jgi:hypothetical protein